MKKTKIPQEVLDVLNESVRVEGLRIILTRELDRKLYVAVDKVLKALGGKWDRKGHAFASDPAPLLAEILGAGAVVDPKKNGFFPTPLALAEELIREADLEPGMLVLEPEAGRAGLADLAAAIVGVDSVHCCELLPENLAVLVEKGYLILGRDFLQVEPIPKYDRVIMNPPFEGLLDIDHVRHAYVFLKPGGRLTAIMSAAVDFRQDKKVKAFRKFVEESGGWWQANPEGSFKESGTMVNTVTVLIEGPPVPAQLPPPADLQAEETTLAIGLIVQNPKQPRKLFDQAALDELAANIRQHGVLQPLVVTKRGESYMIVAGERRWRASTLAGRTHVPVRIIVADDQTVEELALLENLLRRDLNIIEEAQGFQALLDRGMSEEQLAARLGFKQTWRIGERTSLLNLDEPYQKLVIKGQLGNSQAFEMSRVPRGQQLLVFRKINAGELNSYAKLRAFVDSLLNIGVTSEMFALEEVSSEERETLSRLEKMLEQVTKVVCESFKDNELVALRKMRRGNLDLNIQRLDLLTLHLGKIKKALTTAAMQHDALDLVG